MINILVIFGASGDLTSRKLIPALFQLFIKKELPEPFFVVGVSRTPMTDQEWRTKLRSTTIEFNATKFDNSSWNQFKKHIYYFPGNIQSLTMFKSLKQFLKDLEKNATQKRTEEEQEESKFNSSRKGTNCVYYLSIAPKLYADTITHLGNAGMTEESTLLNQPIELRKIIIEKPFGTSLSTARELNQRTHQVFREDQVYRIDHYLGKETVNNIFALRFANTIFEPIWNRNYIDHIQITANEAQTVGHRGAFYETAGVLRDMFQNHLLQLLTITTMEPPNRFDAQSVRDEKVKVLRSIRSMTPEYIYNNTIRGQYSHYRDEKGVDPHSNIATFAAIKLYIDNWRWNNVPIYLRSGKGMSCQTTQIVIQYKEPPHSIFRSNRHPDSKIQLEANRLLIQIQPSEGIKLGFMSKVPGTEMELRNSNLTFSFHDHYSEELPEAYQRLLLDAFSGDASLFARNDEVEAAWEIIDPIQHNWDKTASSEAIHSYPVGFWGPDASEKWMQNQGKQWFNLCPVINSSGKQSPLH
ncbi:MAG: glucose-6-phosphate dehydrogenase [Planctomycetia bacterium]|nr:glucose-6-phosphate dehydrogenase [Planctomycetia bacterium]